MNKPLVILIPGLGSGGLNPASPDTWPAWVVAYKAAILCAIPGAVVVVGNYTDGELPERIIATEGAEECDGVVLVGHSDGAACEDWIQTHVRRLGEMLRIDLMVLLDLVTDLIRHGWIVPLDPKVVLRAVWIHQTGDPLIHANPIRYADASRKVEEYSLAGAPFNAPCARHSDVPAIARSFVVQMISSLVPAAAAAQPPNRNARGAGAF